MASDTTVKPEDFPAAQAVAAAVPNEPSLPQAVGVIESFMSLLRGIDKKVSDLPSSEKIKEQWEKQNDLYEKSKASWILEEESRNLMKMHIGDMAALRETQKISDERQERLTTAQDRLANSLEHINDNLKNGFALGTAVVRLFGKITFVFLASIVVLALVIVWIAKLNISHEGKGGGKTSIFGEHESKAPEVEFNPSPTPTPR